MNARMLTFAVVVGGLPLPVNAQTAAPPPGAAACSGCHVASTEVETPVPRLEGRAAAEIVAAMQQFRAGQRPATVMDRLAKGFSAEEVQAIAAWYNQQK
ncbi:MAG TPA: cytochrome C [Reyranella sp.]|nr:cytochrome C [Reyranella sp.]